MDFYYDDISGLSILQGCVSRDDVRLRINLPYRELPQPAFLQSSMDAFDGATLKAFYDLNDVLKGIELCDPWAKFWFRGAQLLGLAAVDLKTFVQANGYDVTISEEENGLDACHGHLKFYVPDLLELGDQAGVEGVYMDMPYTKPHSLV